MITEVAGRKMIALIKNNNFPDTGKGYSLVTIIRTSQYLWKFHSLFSY